MLVTKHTGINTTERLKIKERSSLKQADANTEKEGAATLLGCRMEFWENKDAVNLRLIKTDSTGRQGLSLCFTETTLSSNQKAEQWLPGVRGGEISPSVKGLWEM